MSDSERSDSSEQRRQALERTLEDLENAGKEKVPPAFVGSDSEQSRNAIENALDDLDNLSHITTREKFQRAPFGWPGGKWKSLKYLIPVLPPGRIFHEGCGGSGVVTLNSPDHYKLKVFNDRHAGVVAFYRCLRDHEKMEKMRQWLACTLHSREEFLWCKETWENCEDDVERACRWFYMLRASFSSLGRNWARTINHHSMIAKKMQNTIEDLPAIHERWKLVQIENLDVLQSIRDFDGDHTVHYIDPDYIGASDIYEHTVEHKALLDLVFASKGWFAVSNYKNDLYESYPWTQVQEWEVDVPMTSRAFTESNNLLGKENVMVRSRKAREMLYIKE